MNPNDDPAVLEAKRRRAARERQSETIYDEDTQCHLRRRKRRFWIWMGLMPGILYTVMMWLVFMPGGRWMRPSQELYTMLFYGLIAWIGYCAIRLMMTKREVSVPGGIGLSIGIFVLLMLLNLVEFHVLFWASCAVWAGLTDHKF